MVTHQHTDSGQVKRFVVTRGVKGWDVREERDSEVVRTATYTDWHRVERAIQVFDLQDPAKPYSTNR